MDWCFLPAGYALRTTDVHRVSAKNTTQKCHNCGFIEEWNAARMFGIDVATARPIGIRTTIRYGISLICFAKDNAKAPLREQQSAEGSA